jgi:hypothetical protein
MKEPMNIANAGVIIACLYFLITGEISGIGKVGIIIILLLALASWGWWSWTDDHKKLLSKQIEETEARIRNINAHTTFMTAQSALTVRGIRGQ